MAAFHRWSGETRNPRHSRLRGNDGDVRTERKIAVESGFDIRGDYAEAQN